MRYFQTGKGSALATKAFNIPLGNRFLGYSVSSLLGSLQQMQKALEPHDIKVQYIDELHLHHVECIGF